MIETNDSEAELHLQETVEELQRELEKYGPDWVSPREILLEAKVLLAKEAFLEILIVMEDDGVGGWLTDLVNEKLERLSE